MTSSEANLRLQFLQNSAGLLCASSVATSGHLMLQHNRILHEAFKSIKSRQHQAWCGSCGFPRQARFTKTVRPKSTTKKGRVRPASVASREVIIYKCLRCASRTIEARAAQPRSLQTIQTTNGSTVNGRDISNANGSIDSPSSRPLPSRPVEAAAEGSTKTMSENASSKKRAKARKQGGLQALLASKQRSDNSGPSASSLDLMDFLQQ